MALSPCLCSVTHATADATAPGDLANAENAVGQAFSTVLAAEQAGANVTELLVRLNDAATFLSQAGMDYRNGDPNTAVQNADNASSIASEVNAAAVDAKETASVTGQDALWNVITFSVVGAIVLSLTLFLIWRRYKQNYVKNMYDAKPEVNSK